MNGLRKARAAGIAATITGMDGKVNCSALPAEAGDLCEAKGMPMGACRCGRGQQRLGLIGAMGYFLTLGMVDDTFAVITPPPQL